jgi:hypothetical protein
VLDVVGHAVPATADRPRGGLGGLRVEDPGLRGGPALRPRQDDLLAAGEPDAQLEALVGLLEHEHVLRRVGPDPVPPQLEGPVGLIVDGVEEPLRVGAPGAAVVGADDPLGQVHPGAQVAEAELEDLVTVGVDAEREQVLVRADQGQPDVEVAGAGILPRNVEEQR